ncbi:hypothetical protein [Sutcliffiella rhizosphaerae]|uniref:NADH dehydrogenase subunit 6 n=1 Tax=Sutcliffiella rhizosphaerae TaxID=2880967 RepID=A0ABN8AB24_9BACI|nr:hypothetical protein [Sutcliffiella rhizosphaerae]CAG9622395.1 hypothetical protein BACCIP111883_03186 [Sutcliffiella rhizosphaerae]
MVIWAIVLLFLIFIFMMVNSQAVKGKNTLELGVISLVFVVAGGVTIYISDTLYVLGALSIVLGVFLFMVGMFLIIYSLFKK